MKEIRFVMWSDTRRHRGYGRVLYRNVRSFWLWLGRHCLRVELHGWGPTP